MRILYTVLSLALLGDVIAVFGLIKKGRCQPKNQALAKLAGRDRCRKACIDEDDDLGRCRNNRICRCARECGFTCINPENLCPPAPKIPNMQDVKYFRGTSNGKLVPLSQTDHFLFDDLAEYVCKPGYRVTGNLYKHYCHGRKGWTGKTYCTRACQTPNRSRALSVGQTCGSKCVIDRDCPGINTACICDGFCGRTCVNEDVDCGSAPHSSNSVIEYTGEKFQKVAHYICDDGYYLQKGNPSRKCTAGGTWDGITPICSRVVCGNPLPAIEATKGSVIDWVPGPYYPGHTFKFSCLSRRLIGSKARTCLNSGRWSGVETRCDNIDEIQRCPHPGVPINGEIERLGQRNFRPGQTIRFSCYPGFVMIGDKEQECLNFLQWSGGGAPACINPAYSDSSAEVLKNLQRVTENAQGVTTLGNSGRFISSGDDNGNEVFFLIDLSGSIVDSSPTALDDSIRFMVKLVERLAANASVPVSYGIIIFASNVRTLLSVSDNQPPIAEIIEILQDISISREKYKDEVLSGTYIAGALNELLAQLAESYLLFPDKKRHCFLITDGKHNKGGNPVEVVRLIIRNFDLNPPEFYSITTCVECVSGNGASSYEELFGLALQKRENFIFIKDFYQIQTLLDQVTDARVDYSKCGQAGDVGSIKQQAQIGRVSGSTKAADRSWPWQVVLSQFGGTVFGTYHRQRFLGGGTILNNRWILTAAHLFLRSNKEDPNWYNSIAITYGMHERPSTQLSTIPSIVRVFLADLIIEHSRFTLQEFDYDIALVRIGQEQILNEDSTSFIPGPNFGWVNYTEYIQPICIPCMGGCVRDILLQQGVLAATLSEEESCEVEGNWLLQPGNSDRILAVVTGFGHSDERTSTQAAVPAKFLRQGLIRIRSKQFCETNNPPNGIIPTDRMLCGTSGIPDGTIDACRGDSGGPLAREVYNVNTKESCWVQLGIVSWGWGCGQYRFVNGIRTPVPGYYTNLLEIVPWIKETLNNNTNAHN